MGFAIESAIGEGARVFDLLKGDHPYKSSWSNDVRSTFDLVAYNTSALGTTQTSIQQGGESEEIAAGRSAAARRTSVMSSGQDSHDERLVELDVLRGLAALAVMLYHYTVRFTQLYPNFPPAAARLPAVFSAWILLLHQWLRDFSLPPDTPPQAPT